MTLDRVAQDGMKVRAQCGCGFLPSQPTLEEALTEAEEQLRQLKEELDTDPAAGKTRQQAARVRAAEGRAHDSLPALEQLPKIAESKKAKDREKARASATDADARVMKMGDGGFRPAYNVQFATAADSQVITGADVVNSGGDQGQLAPMVEQHQERYSETPKKR